MPKKNNIKSNPIKSVYDRIWPRYNRMPSFGRKSVEIFKTGDNIRKSNFMNNKTIIIYDRHRWLNSRPLFIDFDQFIRLLLLFFHNKYVVISIQYKRDLCEN